MEDWAQGYVADIPYNIGFHFHTMPAHLAFAMLLAGQHPGKALTPGKILELGFGMGLGIVLAAATSPQTMFEGNDFNPQHVAHARDLAERAGLTNLELREASFQDMAVEAKENQQDVDIIVLHGILSWVSAEAQAAIVEIARMRLKPGGLLYVSYNAMPGRAPFQPIQRLMLEAAKLKPGRSDQQTASGFELIMALRADGARYFANYPVLGKAMDEIVTKETRYLSHEYMNQHWFAFHVADVMEMFGRAKLQFAASATLSDQIDLISIPPQLRKRIGEVTDTAFRETLRDFAMNQLFRRDVFARGTLPLSPSDRDALIDRFEFALHQPRGDMKFKFKSPLGDFEGRPLVYSSITELLTAKRATFREIAALPVFNDSGRGAAFETLAILVDSGQVLPIVSNEAIDPEPARRLNRVIIERVRAGSGYHYLAMPFARTAANVSRIDLFVLDAIEQIGSQDIERLTDHLLGSMARFGLRAAKEGKAVTDQAEARAIMRLNVEKVLTERRPLWQSLGAF